MSTFLIEISNFLLLFAKMSHFLSRFLSLIHEGKKHKSNHEFTRMDTNFSDTDFTD